MLNLAWPAVLFCSFVWRGRDLSMAIEIFICLLGIGVQVSTSAPLSATPVAEDSLQVPIVRQINHANKDGSYAYGYEAADGTFRVESRDALGNVQGKYGFVDELGNLKVLQYSANRATGYTASSELLPKLPFADKSPKVSSGASKNINTKEDNQPIKVDQKNQKHALESGQDIQKPNKKQVSLDTKLVPPSSTDSLPKQSHPEVLNQISDQTINHNNHLSMTQDNPAPQHVSGLLFIPHYIATVPSGHQISNSSPSTFSNTNLIPLVNPLENPSNFLIFFPFPNEQQNVHPTDMNEAASAQENRIDGGNAIFFLPPSINNEPLQTVER